MGQQETTMMTATEESGGGTLFLRRMILVFAVAALMAAMMVATAMPAMADTTGEQRGPGTQGPPSVTGDINGQGKGSDVFHDQDGTCVSIVGGGKAAGKQVHC